MNENINNANRVGEIGNRFKKLIAESPGQSINGFIGHFGTVLNTERGPRRIDDGSAQARREIVEKSVVIQSALFDALRTQLSGWLLRPLGRAGYGNFDFIIGAYDHIFLKADYMKNTVAEEDSA